MQKSVYNLKCSYLKKYGINSIIQNTNFCGFKNIKSTSFGSIYCLMSRDIFYYNLISNFCQFLMIFTNRTRVLISMVNMGGQQNWAT